MGRDETVCVPILLTHNQPYNQDKLRMAHDFSYDVAVKRRGPSTRPGGVPDPGEPGFSAGTTL